MTSPASQLAPPHLHWIRASKDGLECDLCRAPIKPDGDCLLSIRRAFETRGSRMIETDPLRVLLCLDCGAKARYTDMAALAQDAAKSAQRPISPVSAPNGVQAPLRRSTDHLSDPPANPEAPDAPFLGDPRD